MFSGDNSGETGTAWAQIGSPIIGGPRLEDTPTLDIPNIWVKLLLQHSDVVYSVKEHGLPNAATWHIYVYIYIYNYIYITQIVTKNAHRKSTTIPEQ
jgi:hypothetical protein